MRILEEINKGITIYYTKNNRYYFIQDNYCHSLKRIKETIEYAKSIGLKVPEDEDEIIINTLAGEKYNRIMCIEFNSKTPLKNLERGFLLEENSRLWDWLKLH